MHSWFLKRWLLTLAPCLICACGHQPTPPAPPTAPTAAAYDLADVEMAGELIAVTLSGPETYYEHQGKEMGVQFALAERFANRLGVRLRMETAHDTTELLQMLHDAKADIAALPLPLQTIRDQKLAKAGFNLNDSLAWAVRTSATELAKALDTWYKPEMVDEARRAQAELLAAPRMTRRHAKAFFQSPKTGVISPYDALFRRYAGQWDWRFFAAMAYQESAFDPEATSWAGAKGLMQIMPATAEHLGIQPAELTQPEKNIAGGVKLMNELYAHFSDIHSPVERQKFALAAYNGGSGHVRDAIRLAEKHGRNTQTWAGVAPFILHLSEPAYYNDPVVRNGYMIGQETFDYVNKVMGYYADYRGGHYSAPRVGSESEGGCWHNQPERASKRNRFSTPQQIRSREDSVFNH